MLHVYLYSFSLLIFWLCFSHISHLSFFNSSQSYIVRCLSFFLFYSHLNLISPSFSAIFLVFMLLYCFAFDTSRLLYLSLRPPQFSSLSLAHPYHHLHFYVSFYALLSASCFHLHCLYLRFSSSLFFFLTLRARTLLSVWFSVSIPSNKVSIDNACDADW